MKNTSKKQKINDTLESLVTKIGEKSTQRNYVIKNQNDTELLNAYNNSWIIRRYIKKSVGDMLKNGRECYFNDTFDEVSKKSFFDTHLNFKTIEIIKDALFNLLLFGEVGILAVTNTAEENYKNQLSDDEAIKRFMILNKNEYKQLKNNDCKFLDSDFLMVKNVKTHKSRILILNESFKSYGSKERKTTSDLNTALEVCKMFDTITTSVSDLIEECKIDIYKIADYNDQIASGNEEIILKRLGLMQRAKSYANGILIDSTDSHETKEINLTGLAELWTKASIVVAGALNRPLSVIFGKSASGMNSGEEDNRSYYEAIAELQNTFLRPIFEFIDPFILGYIGKNNAPLEFDFLSIDSINDKEKAEILNTKATAFNTLVQSGIISESTALKELRDDGLIKNITDNDITEAELLEKELKSNEVNNDFTTEI